MYMQMSLDVILMGCSVMLHGMSVLYNDQILLLTLLLCQTPALSLNLEHLESFPQTFWVCMIGHHQPQWLTVLRGLQLVAFGPQAH